MARRRLRRVLVANRGEIAVRIVRACFDEGLEAVAVVSEADRDSLAARLADRSVVIGPAAATRSYLNVGAVVGAALVQLQAEGWATRWQPVATLGGSSLVGRLRLGAPPP